MGGVLTAEIGGDSELELLVRSSFSGFHTFHIIKILPMFRGTITGQYPGSSQQEN